MQYIPIIVLIILALALLFLLLFLVRAWMFGKFIVRNFERCNVVVDGKKGKGKGLVFQYVIHKRKDDYYCNVDYGGKYRSVRLEDISVYPNTYNNLIQEDIKEVPRTFEEGKDIYIDDGGIYLPSYMDSVLYKHYPSFPVYYAISRHLANHNIHVNIQNLPRLWKALREQADFFVHVKGNIKLWKHILIRVNTYDRFDVACQALENPKVRIFNKFSKAQRDLSNASNGEIKSGWLILSKKHIKYDSRAFERKFYGLQPRIERKRESWFRLIHRKACSIRARLRTRIFGSDGKTDTNKEENGLED